MDIARSHSRIDAARTIACLLVGVVLRLAFVAIRSDQLTQDRDVYLGIAINLVEGRGYCSPGGAVATAFRPPLFPLCLAAGMVVFPPAAVVGGINVLSGLLTVWLTLILGTRLGLGRSRWFAAILVAIDPLLILYTAQPMTESLCTLLATLLAWRLVRPSHPEASPHPAYQIGIGIAFGLLVLCRPTFWLTAPFFVMTWLMSRSAGRFLPNFRQTLSEGMSSVCGTVLIVGPWLIRNWLVFGVPILTTTHGGYTLLLGNNPVFNREVVQQPWGTVWKEASLLAWQSDLESQIERDLGPRASEFERDQWHSRQAKQFIAANPRLFVDAVIYRIRSLWNTSPQKDAASGTASWVINLVSGYYAIVLLAGGVGMSVVIRSRDRRRWLPLYILIGGVQLAHLVYWTNARMRAPLTPAIALFASAVLPRRDRIASEK